MLPVCEPGDSYTVPWTVHGFSRCFLELVGGISSAGFLYVIGLGVIVLGSPPNKSKGRVTSDLPFSKVCVLESVCAVVYALTFVSDIVTKGALHIAGHRIYGYTIVVDALGVFSWLFSLWLIHREKALIVTHRPHGYTLAIFWLMGVVLLGLELVSINSQSWWWHLSTREDLADFILFLVRALMLTLLVVVGLLRPLCCHGRRRSYELLINASTAAESAVVNGDGGDDGGESDAEGKRRRREGDFVRTRNTSAFANIWSKVCLLFPYVWPKGRPLLQLRVLACFVILVGGRIINVYVPIYYRNIVNALTPSYMPASNHTHQLDTSLGLSGVTFPLASILIYVFLRFLQGGSVGSAGFSNNLRSFIWIQVQQYTSRALQVSLFDHLHSLSLRWHLGRKTGEVLRVMDRGTQSINNLLSYILFNIGPTLVDIGVAVVYFIIAFDGWFGLIVFTTMITYIYFTIFITEWRTKYRRIMNERDNATRAKAVDSLLNFETVKYYGAEQYEVDRFQTGLCNTACVVVTAILSYQSAEWDSLASLNVLGFGQNVIITAGLLLGSGLCAYRVTQGVLTVGDFVLYCTYIVQLYSPLNFFGTYYRMIQQAFVDMENLFDLLDSEAEVRDMLHAPPIDLTHGKIEFKNVYFHYTPEKPILRDISFTVPPGETLALVGPSGEGKSTIIRLLFRFYDLQDGAILLDGQDVREVTQSSLRQAIGVVPQDTVLFNDNIQYNVRYGKHEASDEEVEQASKYADIHQRILTFPQQYNTVVGERGLKLSGGEKQRVCIARTMLKAPTIILLDEATSALDTETERNIQSALLQVCEGKTTIIVAHRLSTIIHAHQILVLKGGLIVERGCHDDLLGMGGVYSSMWKQQQESFNTEKGEAFRPHPPVPDSKL